jgi:hypothetical protein
MLGVVSFALILKTLPKKAILCIVKDFDLQYSICEENFQRSCKKCMSERIIYVVQQVFHLLFILYGIEG